MILLCLANGFEEVEALTPLDMLRRAGLDVRTVGIGGRSVTGAHGITVMADALPEEIDLGKVEAVVLPGGMPGTKHLDESAFVEEAIRTVYANAGRLAAICAAPSILGKRGYLKGKMAVCYPGFEKELLGAKVLDRPVITDGRITTARGMGVAFAFGKELIFVLAGAECAEKVATSTMASDSLQ